MTMNYLRKKENEMTFINSKPESCITLVKPHKNETLYSWLARKLLQKKRIARRKEE